MLAYLENQVWQTLNTKWVAREALSGDARRVGAAGVASDLCLEACHKLVEIEDELTIDLQQALLGVLLDKRQRTETLGAARRKR